MSKRQMTGAPEVSEETPARATKILRSQGTPVEVARARAAEQQAAAAADRIAQLRARLGAAAAPKHLAGSSTAHVLPTASVATAAPAASHRAAAMVSAAHNAPEPAAAVAVAAPRPSGISRRRPTESATNTPRKHASSEDGEPVLAIDSGGPNPLFAVDADSPVDIVDVDGEDGNHVHEPLDLTDSADDTAESEASTEHEDGTDGEVGDDEADDEPSETPQAATAAESDEEAAAAAKPAKPVRSNYLVRLLAILVYVLFFGASTAAIGTGIGMALANTYPQAQPYFMQSGIDIIQNLFGYHTAKFLQPMFDIPTLTGFVGGVLGISLGVIIGPLLI